MKDYLVTYALPVSVMETGRILPAGTELTVSVSARNQTDARNRFREWNRYLSNGREKAKIIKIERID